MNDEDFLAYLSKLTDELNSLGFDTDRTETLYALYLAVVHKNKAISNMLSLQIEVMLGKKKLGFRNNLRTCLLKFARSRQHLILLPPTVKSRTEKVLLARKIAAIEKVMK